MLYRTVADCPEIDTLETVARTLCPRPEDDWPLMMVAKADPFCRSAIFCVAEVWPLKNAFQFVDTDDSALVCDATVVVVESVVDVVVTGGFEVPQAARRSAPSMTPTRVPKSCDTTRLCSRMTPPIDLGSLMLMIIVGRMSSANRCVP